MANEKNSASPIKQNWEEQKVKLKAKFNVLTDSDLKFDEGKKNEMLSKLQKKLGKSESELNQIIDKL